MKKLALTNLILLIAIKSVSACSYAIDPNNPNFDPIAENAFYTKIYFYALIFLILANIVLFFLRRQKDYLVLLIIILSALATIPFMFVGALANSCGIALLFVLKYAFIFFLLIFCLHLGLLINKTGLHLRRRKLTEIKLQ